MDNKLIEEIENSYDIFLPKNCTSIICCRGVGFSKVLKPYGGDDTDHIEAMIISAIETSKLMQNFVMAYVQSDKISFVLSNEDYEYSQAWFGNRILKLASVSASSVSINYTVLMSSYKNKLIRGIFDGKVFDLERKYLNDYLQSRIKSGYNNAISKIYRLNEGHTKDKSLTEMEVTLIEDNIEISNLFKYGTIIIKKDREINRINVSDIFDDTEYIVSSIFDDIRKRKDLKVKQ